MGEGGLEPPSLATLVPKTNAYTNSATRPIFLTRILFPNHCASSWDRTNDLILKRDLLYQLSYGRIYLIIKISYLCTGEDLNLHALRH